MLDPKQKENWLTALRSGKYQQAKYKLKDGEGYCCIGVFAVCNGLKIGENGYCSGEVYPTLDRQIGEETQKLWQMNDSDGKSFLEIADYIEQNL